MPAVPLEAAFTTAIGAVPLARYAQLINHNHCAFFGVHAGPDDYNVGTKIWSKWERDSVAKHLNEAQDEIEKVVRYFLQPKWVTGEVHPYANPVVARWGRVIAGGVRAEATVSAGEAVNLAVDPCIVGPVATTVTDEDEIHVFYPGTGYEISPSEVAIAGGNVTISIPKCRLVKYSLLDTPPSGLDYGVAANFQATVDVKRVYNDPSTNAEIVTPHSCGTACAASNCGEYTQDGCVYVRDARLGIVDVRPATYSGGAWVSSAESCCDGSVVRLNYYSGLTELPPQLEDAVVRLAHSKMSNPPCTDDSLRHLWEQDRAIPQVLTRERVNCPFGLSQGAWIAFKFAQASKLTRMSVL